MISIWLKWYWDGYKMVLQKNARRYREGMGIKMSFIQFWQTLCRYGLTAREDWVALKPYLDSGDRLTHLATTTDAQMIKKDFVRTMLQNGRVYSVRSRMPAILDVGGLGSAGDENDGGPPAVRMIVFEVLDVNPGGKVTAERKEYDEFFLPISVQMWTASSAYDDWCCTNFRGKYKHSLGLANGVVDSGGTLPSCFRMLKSGPTIANIMSIVCGGAQVVLAPAR